MHQKAELGKYMGGTVPLGYKISKDKDYIIDENTAFIVKQIYERYADGYTIKEICNELNVAGYKTASGKPFSYSSLHTMLINPKYIGKYEYLGVVLENAIPQIVDNETFEKVQQRLQKNKRSPQVQRVLKLFTLRVNYFAESAEAIWSVTVGQAKLEQHIFIIRVAVVKIAKGVQKNPSKRIGLNKLSQT